MLSMLRIFKYARQRIIELRQENEMLKAQIEFWKAIAESNINVKH